MDDEIGIDLRRYIEVLVRQWRFVVIAPIIASVVALVISLLSPPVYEARVYVAVAKQKVEVQFGTQIQTLTEEQLAAAGVQSLVNREARLATFRELVANPAIGEKVLPQFADRLRALDENLVDTSHFLDHVSVDEKNTKNDLIGIVVSLPNPVLAADIANAWAQAYEEHINSIYLSAQPKDAEAVRAQAKQSRQAYMTAQQELEAYLADNPTPRLNKQIDILQTQIDSYQNALVETESLVNSRELATRRQLLGGYYGDLVTLEKLLDDARVLQLQISSGENSSAAAFGDALAMIFIRSRTFAGASSESGAPFSLQLQTPLTSGPVAASDVESLIQALEQRQEETETKIADLTATLLDPSHYLPAQDAGAQIKDRIEEWTTEIQSLQARLEAEEAHRKDLERQRDLAWDTYSQLEKKAAEVKVAAESGGTEVRVASLALPPTKPVSPRKLFNTALAGMVGLAMSVFLALALEWWRNE
jgi:uncharacterized protein involved in exopolysaccharide biosynthesis